MSTPIPRTGRKEPSIGKRWMFRFAVADSKGDMIPLFRSPRLNRKIAKMAQAIRKQKTRAK